MEDIEPIAHKRRTPLSMRKCWHPKRIGSQGSGKGDTQQPGRKNIHRYLCPTFLYMRPPLNVKRSQGLSHDRGSTWLLINRKIHSDKYLQWHLNTIQEIVMHGTCERLFFNLRQCLEDISRDTVTAPVNPGGKRLRCIPTLKKSII